MKSESSSFDTEKSVQTLGRTLQDALARARAASIGPIQSGSGALSQFDDKADIEVVAQGRGLVGGSWAVQVFVRDTGQKRNVELVALGDSGMARVMDGYRNSISLQASVKKRDEIAAALR
ncbi:hypothetical protein SAMN06295885_3575 [Rathayibacter oskolensis]|uniref:Uncharacterized protein n=1 Tax=Rathayibacter oskolensis TaxID=1891671 RepID=A0A1X7PGV1_9MICO|nr:hypothetical protein [Rathayibacter oskolensis]SMH50551.1 hypothetical protein SAMN06295885_3575 [Rathayibacter oskolensis]